MKNWSKTSEHNSTDVQSLNKKISTRMGFEPTRAEPIGLAVQRLNNSATPFVSQSAAQKVFPRRELNPGLLGESQIS